uniref:Metallothionein-like protein n=1 Tax=Salvia miltiorrhiza TaxID=226208 RepID=G4Y3P3_SALMI|nr:metallothionein 1 [Salvia miltiorrhiza]
MSSGCKCGSSCGCGSGCSCEMDVEKSTSIAMVEGVAPPMMKIEGAEKSLGAEGGNGCTCGSSCSCDPCTC